MRATVRGTRWIKVAAALGAIGLVLGGCGDDGTDSAGSDDAPSDEAGSSDEAADAGECAGTDVTISGPGGDVEVISSAAVSLVDGAAYTVYLADFELDGDAITMFSAPEIPDDGSLATVAVTIFNAEEDPAPIEQGTTVEWTSDFGVLTYAFTIEEGEELHGTNTGAEGTLEITAVGDTFCGDIDYTDGEKSISGTIEAPVTALS